jgi:hypothetical protein
MGRRIALAVSVVAAMGAAPAQAASTTVFSADSYLSSPALAGDRVLFEQFPAAGALRVLSVPVAGGGATTLTSAKRATADSSVVATYAGSAQAVWVRRIVELGPVSVLTGSPAGPLTSVEECGSERDYDFESPGPAVDGDLVVWAGAGCKQHQVHIQSGASSRVVDAGDFVYAVAAGGHYAAWLRLIRPADSNAPTQTRLVVVDALTGTEAYSTTVPQSSDLELEPDGTAVISTFLAMSKPCNGGSNHFLYYTRAEPVAHEVPGVVSCVSAFRVANGRLAFVGTDAQATITLTDLTGSTFQPVAGLGNLPVGSFDFDGARVALSSVGCRSYSVRVRDAADTSAADPPPACPVAVGKPRLARDRTIHVPIRCPNGCRGRGSGNGMTIVSPRFLHVWSQTRTNTRYAPYVHFDLKPGGRATLRLPTTAHQRALIRRKRRVPVRVKTIGQNIYLPRIARTVATFG